MSKDTTRHEAYLVRQAIRGVLTACRYAEPDDNDLRAEGLPPDLWWLIRSHGRKIRGYREANRGGWADEQLSIALDEILRRVPADWRPPKPAGPDLTGLDPRQVADATVPWR